MHPKNKIGTAILRQSSLLSETLRATWIRLRVRQGIDWGDEQSSVVACLNP